MVISLDLATSTEIEAQMGNGGLSAYTPAVGGPRRPKNDVSIKLA